MTTFILRALNANGAEFFYTGRAGDGWVSKDAAEAFTYSLLEGAENAAKRHNKFTELHGLRFTAWEVQPTFQPGQKVRTCYGETETVLFQRGCQVFVGANRWYHPTKVWAI
jgi:hypothetical protein